MRIFTSFLIFVFLGTSCTRKNANIPDHLIGTYGLAGSNSARNTAVLIGAPNGLSGVETDIREMVKVFESKKYDFKFEPAVNGNATARQVIDLVKVSSKDSDSLFFYFSGHGNDGVLLADDRTFTFREVADAIKTARENKPLKRLVVMLDSCLSGSFVDGESPIIDESGNVLRMKKIDDELWYQQMIEQITLQAVDGALYEEAFIFASSKKDENSMDLGSQKGGAFTFSLRSEIERLANADYDNAKIKDLLPGVIKMTERLGDHTPVFKAYPEQDVLEDWLFKHKL
jgi:hypothetical protein